MENVGFASALGCRKSLVVAQEMDRTTDASDWFLNLDHLVHLWTFMESKPFRCLGRLPWKSPHLHRRLKLCGVHAQDCLTMLHSVGIGPLGATSRSCAQ